MMIGDGWGACNSYGGGSGWGVRRGITGDGLAVDRLSIYGIEMGDKLRGW